MAARRSPRCHDAVRTLREQLQRAAETFSAGILPGMVDDVERALAESLEIFPVCHHSPASALAMVRRLREKQPKVIYLELCEDLLPVLTELRNCRLPVAVQAFASTVEGFPAGSGPLSVVAPITESSAEYQAIAYALDTPDVELVLVDRSTDHVFQWLRQQEEKATDVAIELGDLRPGFAELEEHLLHHGKVRHWSEWWDQYVEQPLAGADYDTYRQVMVLVGSLFRRLRPERPGDDRDEERERYMWTRMREHLAASGTDPADCLYVCGAFHAASRVEQFGLEAAEPYEITPRTSTKWLYGLIPSSHTAIEEQFGLASGSVSIAAATWDKAIKRHNVRPFQLEGQKGTKKRAAKPVVAKIVIKPRMSLIASPASSPPRPSSTTSTRPSCSAGASTWSGWPGATAIWPAPPTPSRSTRRRSCSPGCATGPGPRRTTSRTRPSPASRRTSCPAGGTCAGCARSCSAATASGRSGTRRCRRWPATSTTGSPRSASTWRSGRSSGP